MAGGKRVEPLTNLPAPAARRGEARVHAKRDVGPGLWCEARARAVPCARACAFRLHCARACVLACACVRACVRVRVRVRVCVRVRARVRART